MQPQRRLLLAGALVTANRTLRPGAVLVEDSRVLATGFPQELGQPADATVVSLTDRAVIPALVNAHAHLDLSHIGPKKFDGDFTRWVDALRARRHTDSGAIAESVALGARLSRAGGTAAVGDIAGARSLAPTQAMREQRLAGVSFFEVFGAGRTQAAAVDVMRRAIESTPRLDRGVRHGLQPHAPYSCGPDVYRSAVSLVRNCSALSTHLAETREELAFVDRAFGPIADMLRRLGAWDDTIAGFGVHPIDHVADLLDGSPCLAAHVNHVDDRHLEVLTKSNITVAYCPRASAYFGHEGHRYRDMLNAGINVALGTDSILCLDTPDRMSVLDEMRMLHRRDSTDAMTLLRMATINGAAALGLRRNLFLAERGETAGLISLRIDPNDQREALSQALRHDEPPRWELGPVAGENQWFEGERDA